MDVNAGYRLPSFLNRLKTCIQSNLENDQFGVTQLADAMNMSRSNLHRKLKKEAGKSISQYIREYRLQFAHDLLQKQDRTASEVAYAVGFGSASYFSKCFSEHYGYPPSKTSQFPRQLNGQERPPRKSIVVIPFKNLSSDEDSQYLSEGIVDAITRHLNSIEALKVLSPLAMLRFQNQVPSLQRIKKELGVSSILRGSLQRSGDMLRLEISLIDLDEEEQLWSRMYDEELYNLLKVQNDIAKNVATALEANLNQDQIFELNKATSYDPEAYDNYLRGWNYLMTFSPENHKKSYTFFKKAIELDPNMIFGHLGMLTYWHFAASIFSRDVEPRNALKFAEEHLCIAEKMNMELESIHSSRGFQALANYWDFAQCEVSYKKSLKSNAPLHLGVMRDFFHMENRFEEAFNIAKKVDEEYYHYPVPIMINSYYFRQEWDIGRQYLEERLRLHPNSYYTLESAGFFYLNTGDYALAIALFEGILKSAPYRIPKILGLLGAAYVQNGDAQQSRIIIEELSKLKATTNAGSPGWFIAVIYSALGQVNLALDWLQRAVDDHELELIWLVSEPQLYPLHGHPNFDALVKMVGFRKHAYPVQDPRVKQLVGRVSPYVTLKV